MRLTINHSTRYHYDVPAFYALQQLRVRPQSSPSQTILDWKVDLAGAKSQVSFIDQHGNMVDLVEFLPDAVNVCVTVTGEVETSDTAGIAGAHELLMPLWFYLRQTKLTAPGEAIRMLVRDLPAKHAEADSVSHLHGLSHRILERVPYLTGKTGATTTAEGSLQLGQGVCQDHTHIFLSAARLLGYPARYVSGYLMMNDRIDQDASHAWAEVHIDGLGWVGFDVSNAISPDERYVHIARGLDYGGSAPTTGFIMGAERENLIVSLQVQQ
jgi:transglutaminase-like putative cysteine protease